MSNAELFKLHLQEEGELHSCMETFFITKLGYCRHLIYCQLHEVNKILVSPKLKIMRDAKQTRFFSLVSGIILFGFPKYIIQKSF
jgi:hypothetical protein